MKAVDRTEILGFVPSSNDLFFSCLGSEYAAAKSAYEASAEAKGDDSIEIAKVEVRLVILFNLELSVSTSVAVSPPSGLASTILIFYFRNILMKSSSARASTRAEFTMWASSSPFLL